MSQVHDRPRHVQGVLSPREYVRFRAAAERHGLSLQEAARSAILQWTHSAGGQIDPFDALVGSFHGPTDASADPDADYEAD